MEEMIQAAMEQAFGKCMEVALQPLLVRMTELENGVNTLLSQQAELIAWVDGIKGNGFAKRLLGTG